MNKVELKQMIKQIILEDVNKQSTPQKFVEECDILLKQAEIQLGKLDDILYELGNAASYGKQMFEGRFANNEYGITKNMVVSELFDRLSGNTKGNARYSLRDTKKYLGWVKNNMEEIKSSNLSGEQK